MPTQSRGHATRPNAAGCLWRWRVALPPWPRRHVPTTPASLCRPPRRGTSILRRRFSRSSPRIACDATARMRRKGACAWIEKPPPSLADNAGLRSSPGRVGRSRLVRFVAGADDEQIVMPPEGERLTKEEIGRLRAWIDQGALWTEPAAPAKSKSVDHWAFKRPARPKVPVVKNRGWIRNEIDAFVLAQLEKRGFEPAPEADRSDTHSPRLVGSRRALAAGRRGRPLCRRSGSRCVRAARRPAAGVATFRRTLGPPLARSGPVRRQFRVRVGYAAERLAVSRLGDTRDQRRLAV